MGMRRRQYLATMTTALSALAGCLTSGDTANQTPRPQPTSTPPTQSPQASSRTQTRSGQSSTSTKSTHDPSPDWVVDASEITLTSRDVSPDTSAYQLTVEYNWTTVRQWEVKDGVWQLAEDGHKWVLVHCRVYNPGAERTVTAHQYVLETADTEFEFVAAPEHGLHRRTVASKGSVDGWILFHVPQSLSKATFTMDQSAIQETVQVSFSHNPELPPLFPREADS
jgi:hypothetical protein